jgi:hypothetical protein
VVGGAEEIRTPDIRLAKAALSQLSYGPGFWRLEPGGWMLEGLAPASSF